MGARDGVRRELRRDLQRVQSPARVPVGRGDEIAQRVVVDGDVPELAREGPARQGREIVVRERPQHVHPGPGQQGRVHLERRVLRGGAHEHHRAALDVGQEGVLLRLVEAVHLVDEEHGGDVRVLPGVLDRRAYVADAGEHGGQARPPGPGGMRQDPRQGGLAGPGRSPEDHRGDASRVGQAREGTPGAQEVPLAHEIGQRRRAHARRQGLVGGIGVDQAIAGRVRHLAARPRRPERRIRTVPARWRDSGSGCGNARGCADRDGRRCRCRRAAVR